jgi:hypothetical protein
MHVRLTGWGTRDEEPLVNAWVNWSWELVLAFWDVEIIWADAIWRVGESGVGPTSLALSVDEGSKLTG